MNIQKRKGFLKISEQLLGENEVDFFKAIFSNFFPIGIQPDYSCGYNDRMYFGLSPYFDEIEKGESVPEYMAIIHTDRNMNIILHEMKRK